MKTRHFGRDAKGREAVLITLENSGGMKVTLTNFGARLVGIECRDRRGALKDVCLGFDSLEEYETRGGYLGATIGRWSNRIGGASFELAGKTYPLYANDGRNALHGGKEGFDKKFWDYEQIGDNGVRFRYVSPDMEEGFPGELDTRVTFTLGEGGELDIRYQAVGTKDTVINLTNHAYFNLAGEGTVHDHLLQVNAARVLAATPDLIPTGDFLDVAGTPYDLRAPRRIGDCLTMRGANRMFDDAKGFDIDYALEGHGLREAAVLSDPASGRRMRVRTDQPGLQVYSGQGLSGKGKNGAELSPYAGIALETQHHPDSVHLPGLPTTVLLAGKEFDSRTVYVFDAV